MSLWTATRVCCTTLRQRLEWLRILLHTRGPRVYSGRSRIRSERSISGRKFSVSSSYGTVILLSEEKTITDPIFRHPRTLVLFLLLPFCIRVLL